MSKSSASKIRLNNFEDLFGRDDDQSASSEIRDVKLSELYPFKNHPFLIRQDQRMTELIASIKDNGVLVPGVARPRPQGGYEIISGHCRKYACEVAGLSEMPMFIRNVTDDMATIIMVDSNIQREDILPSEKAKAYKMKYDAIKHQGKKGDSLKLMMEQSGESRSVIQRYIQLATLSNDLLKMVDEKKLGFTQGVNLSELSPSEQEAVFTVIQGLPGKLSVKDSDKLKAQKGNLAEEQIKSILDKEKSISAQSPGLHIGGDILESYFPKGMSDAEIRKIIVELLEQWKKETGR